MIQSEYQHWLLDFARSKGPKSILYSCDGTLGLVSHNKAAIPVRALNISPDAIARVMESGIYDAIYVFDLVVRDDDSGSWYRMPGASGLDTALYAAEVEQEVYFNDRTRARAYRLTGIYAH